MYTHIPVLAQECIELLKPAPNACIVDGTLGLGGHAKCILKQLGTEGMLIGVDQDPNAIEMAVKNIGESHSAKFLPIHGNFFDLPQLLKEAGIQMVNGVLLDLGVSSYQLDDPTRGFSYQADGPLDMRMNPQSKITAADIVNRYSQRDLEQVIFDYGEERWARRIAQFIVERRKEKPYETTAELVDTIKAAIPAGARKNGPHPAKRTFQALRIEVNGELENLERGILQISDLLDINGVLCIITFHSLEDRIVKQTFAKLAKRCTCPPEAIRCTCDRKERFRILTKHPIVPSEVEEQENPRCRSAKVRAIRRLAF